MHPILSSLLPTSSQELPEDRAPLQVALVDEELPFPPVSGKRIRSLSLARRLARRHQLTYIAHRNADPSEAREAAAYLGDHHIRTVVVDRPVPAKAGAGFYLRLAANLFSPLPYSVATHTSRALRQALQEHAARNRVDLWHCEWTPYAEALQCVPGRRVVMAHNVESVIWQRYHETESGQLRRWYIARQLAKFQRFERRVLGQADRTIAVSDTDAERLARDFGVARLDVVENGVDTEYFRPRGTPRNPAQVLFLGSLDWRPNLDGVQLLLERVVPAVRAQVPEATFCLVGRNPPEALRRQAAGMRGVELHGNVPDVRPFLAACGLLVVPLRIGGGSRLKILEALASGAPVVSTRVGAEGLHLEADHHLVVVEEIEDLVNGIVAAIRAPEAAQAQAERGRQQVLDRYDWDRLAQQMEQVWLRCLAEVPRKQGRS